MRVWISNISDWRASAACQSATSCTSGGPLPHDLMYKCSVHAVHSCNLRDVR